MRKTLLVTASVTGLLLAFPTTVHGNPGTATITLNGQNIPVNGPVQCVVDTMGFTLEIGHDQGAAWVVIGDSPAWDNQPTAVTRVTITDTWGNSYEWDQRGQFHRGDAQYHGPADPDVRSAGSYKITGHIPMVMPVPSPPPQAPRIGPVDPNTSPLQPFEVDATCQ